MMVKNARLSFPSLFRATSFQPDHPKKFSATFVVEKDTEQHKALKQEMLRVAEEKWPGKGKDVLKQLKAQGKLAVRDGAEKGQMDGFGDSVVFFNASTDKRPGVFDKGRNPVSEEDGLIYPGCYVNAQVEFWCQDNQYGKRINAQLRGVQFAGDGDPLGGGGPPATAEDFPELEDEDDFGGSGGDPVSAGDDLDDDWD